MVPCTYSGFAEKYSLNMRGGFNQQNVIIISLHFGIIIIIIIFFSTYQSLLA